MPTLEELSRYAEHFNEAAMLKFWGVKLSFPSTERVIATLDPVRPEHRGGLGTEAVNGGVLAALFDLTVGVTAALVDPKRRNATMQLSMSFERPVLGDRLTVHGFIHQRGTTTLFSGAEVHDAAGNVCARCQGVIRLGRGTWGGPSPAPDVVGF